MDRFIFYFLLSFLFSMMFVCMVDVVRVCSFVLFRSTFDTCVLICVLLSQRFFCGFCVRRVKNFGDEKRMTDGRWTDDCEKLASRQQTRQWRCVRIFFRRDMNNSQKNTKNNEKNPILIYY